MKQELLERIDYIKECNKNIVTYPEYVLDDNQLYDDTCTVLDLLNDLVCDKILHMREIFKIRINYDKIMADIFLALTDNQVESFIYFIEHKVNETKKESINFELYETAANIKRFEQFDYEKYFKEL